MTNVRTILVPVDFSDGSLAAVRHARELADIFHSHVHLLHVASGPDAPAWAIEFFAAQLRPVEEHRRMQTLDQLATLVVKLRLDPLRTTGLVRTGCAEEAIAQYADELHADLIIMGSHGERFIPQLRIGQVTERVLGLAKCPVITVPEDRNAVVHVPTDRRLNAATAATDRM